jgi:predicted Fe-Mo cluster-binding NifX family protein
MRVAVPNCRGRVSPVFDVARRYRVIDVNSGKITDQAEHVVCGEPCRELMELAVDRVICAGITRELKVHLGRHGIGVLAGFCGAIDEVINAYLCDRLGCGDFNMPGSTWDSRGLSMARGNRG